MDESGGSSGSGFQSKKYDRQIRLWGEQGQKRLQVANICLLGCGPTGSETLKNLVLGNINQYTIIDHVLVSDRDLTNNFLISHDRVGISRAESVHLGLQELNSQVVGSFEDATTENIISRGIEFFSKFTMIIATQLSEQECIKLQKICLQIENMSLLIVRCYGLVGYLRILKKEHCVIESRSDFPLPDLRVNDPWPELMSYAQSLELDKLDNLTHKHIPYAILLILTTITWKESHNGQLPQNYQEQKQFKQMIEEIRRRADEDGKMLDEENVDEAVQSAQLVWSRTGIPDNVQNLLQQSETDLDLRNSSDFWVVLEAIRMFVEKEGCGKLPLEGSIPDMVATTDMFVKLQSLYREKATKDQEIVAQYTRQICEQIERPVPSHDFIKLVCKNSKNLSVVQFKTLEDEFRENHRTLQIALNSEDNKQNATIYLLFRAIDRFYTQNQRFPGCEIDENQNWEQDESKLAQIADALAWEMGVGGIELDKDMVLEMCRFGACELHNVGAFMGGVGAQEAIKIITEQFVPLSDTFIYNGIKQTTSLF